MKYSNKNIIAGLIKNALFYQDVLGNCLLAISSLELWWALKCTYVSMFHFFSHRKSHFIDFTIGYLEGLPDLDSVWNNAVCAIVVQNLMFLVLNTNMKTEQKIASMQDKKKDN